MNTADYRLPGILGRFPHQVNPHVEQARRHLVDWVQHMGLVHGESARKRFDRADFGWFAGMVYPTADSSHLDLMADWFAWLFLVDDQLDDGTVGRSLERVNAIVDSLRAVVESPASGKAITERADVPRVISSLTDLWERTAADTTQQWRRRFIGHLGDCLTTAATWEAGNRVKGIVPDERTYIAKRRHTGAIYVCMDLIDIVERIDVPESLYYSPRFMTALDTACNIVCWTNDVYSLEKERSLGEVHNLAYIVQHHRHLDRQEALTRVCSAISAEIEVFLAAEEELRRAHSEHADVLVPYLAGMRNWIRGNLDWSRHTQRYHHSQDTSTRPPEEYLESGVMGLDSAGS